MKPQSHKPALATKKELPLSGPALEALMRAVLDKKVPFRFRANGFSMAPFIKDGDLLTVYPLPYKPPGFGDVLAFSHPASGKLMVHRVVSCKKSACRFKGDNTHAVDGFVPQTSLIGIIRKVERNGYTVPLGLGPERFLIALLSANCLLSRILQPLRSLFQLLRGVRYDV